MTVGLDITAYTKLTSAPDAECDPEDDGGPVDYANFWLARREVIEWTETEWPGRTTGIQAGMVYAIGGHFTFPAGSYGTYNRWREWLATVAGFESPRDVGDAEIPPKRPFVELIDFADNEGVIGPTISAKLAKDFADYEDAAEKMSTHPLDMERYRYWRRAFDMASDHGTVEFH